MKSLRAAVLNGAWLVLMLIVGTLCLNPHGCRSMSNIVFERRNPYGIEYHAKDEELLASGKPVPSLLRAGVEMSRQYSATLSQPIAITSWRGDSPTWEIFFATNRDIISATEGSSQERFGNSELNETPPYGRAAISLPFRRRGVDPQREAPAGSDSAQQSIVTFEEVRSLPWEAMAAGVKNQIARSRQHDLLLFVHGFNVDFESALIRTAQLGLDIPFNGAVVAYSWPSQGGAWNYPIDEPINARSVRPFTELLQRLVVAVPEDTRINIVVHSMGNRIVMQAISQLPRLNGKPIANLVLCGRTWGYRSLSNWHRRSSRSARTSRCMPAGAIAR